MGPHTEMYQLWHRDADQIGTEGFRMRPLKYAILANDRMQTLRRSGTATTTSYSSEFLLQSKLTIATRPKLVLPVLYVS